MITRRLLTFATAPRERPLVPSAPAVLSGGGWNAAYGGYQLKGEGMRAWQTVTSYAPQSPRG